MLLYLDKTISNFLKEESSNQEDQDRVSMALTQIVDGRKNGRHIVFGERKTLQNIMLHFFNSEGSKSPKYVVFKRVYENFSATSSLFKLLKNIFYVNVVFDNSSNYISDKVLNINIKNCPNANFDFFLNKTILLLENNDDAKYYYKPITLRYLDSHKINWKFIDYEPIQTGGSSVDQAIKDNIIAMNNFCFGLTDSDERFGTIPSSNISFKLPQSATCLKFQELRNVRTDNFLYDCYTLNVRDVENLVYIDLLLPYLTKSNTIKQNIDNIKSIINNDETKESCFYKYFDFENGVKKGDKDEIQYWQEIFCVPNHMIPFHGISSKDNMKSFCNNGVIVNAIIKNLPKLLQEEWLKISQLVFSRCCAYKDKPIKNS